MPRNSAMGSVRTVLTASILFVFALLAHAGSAAATHAPFSSCTPGRQVNYGGESWLGGRPYEYRIIVSSFPDDLRSSAQSRDRTIARIRDGVRAWNQGRNDCHLRRFETFDTALAGTSGSSGGNHEDGISTTDFAPPSDLGCGDPTLAGCTIVRRLGGADVQTKVGFKANPREADVRFRREGGYWRIRRRTRGCSENPRVDLWSLAAHEIGHVVGLDNFTGSGEAWQTMNPAIGNCEFWPRQLGRGDYIGLKNLYTFGVG